MQPRAIPDSTLACRLMRCLPVYLLIAKGAASLGSDTLAGSIAYENYKKTPSGGIIPPATPESTPAPPASAPLKSDAFQSTRPDNSFHSARFQPSRNGSIRDRRLQACVCKGSWTSPDDGCVEVQYGCPAVACAGDFDPWCIVSNPGCATEHDDEGWTFCEPPITTRWTLLEGGKNKQCGKWRHSAHRYEDVFSRLACEEKAMENEHTHLSYKKSAARCMTSHGCDDINSGAGWKIYTAPVDAVGEPTLASIHVTELWGQLSENKRCKRYAGTREYKGVTSEVQCQGLAISNGHTHFSFKRSNGKCFTTPGCASKRVKRGWGIYKGPRG